MTTERYLSLLEATGLIIVLLTAAYIISFAVPLAYDSILFNPLIKILLFGGLLYTVIRVRHLDTAYLLPRAGKTYNIFFVICIAISFFLISATLIELEELARVGYEKYMHIRGERLFVGNSK